MKRSESRDPRQGGVPLWMWAGIAALIGLTAYSAWDARQLQREIRELQARSETMLKSRVALLRERDELQRETMILNDPASITVALSSTNKNVPPLEAKWHSELGILLIGNKIPQLPGTHVLQLWLVPKAARGTPIPSITMRPEADGKLVVFVANPPGDMAKTKALMVSEEPAGGSSAPSSALLWTGGIR